MSEPQVSYAEQVLSLRVEAAQLRGAVESRACIDQAKGMLVLRYGVDPAHAWATLARWSSEWNVKVRDLAQVMTTSRVVDPAELRCLVTTGATTPCPSTQPAA